MSRNEDGFYDISVLQASHIITTQHDHSSEIKKTRLKGRTPSYDRALLRNFYVVSTWACQWPNPRNRRATADVLKTKNTVLQSGRPTPPSSLRRGRAEDSFASVVGPSARFFSWFPDKEERELFVFHLRARVYHSVITSLPRLSFIALFFSVIHAPCRAKLWNFPYV